MTYIVQADLEARLSARVIREILDDDASGAADAANITRVIADAESYCEGFIRGNYDLTTIRALGTAAPNELKRLCIDVATAYLWDRHPEYVRAHGDKLLERARRDLIDLRNGVTRFDVTGTPEPAANQGGVVRSGDPEQPDESTQIFAGPDGLGIF